MYISHVMDTIEGVCIQAIVLSTRLLLMDIKVTQCQLSGFLPLRRLRLELPPLMAEKESLGHH